VGGRFTANKNPLKDMTGGPLEVSGRVGFRQEVPVLSLAGFPQRVGQHLSINYHNKLPLLRALNCQQGLMLYAHNVMQSKRLTIEGIFYKYAGQGKRALFDCQKELEDAGFEGNARW
jgi:alkylated DNA nucleotide flippase Atl1